MSPLFSSTPLSLSPVLLSSLFSSTPGPLRPSPPRSVPPYLTPLTAAFSDGPCLIIFRANNSAKGIVRGEVFRGGDPETCAGRLEPIFDKLIGGETAFTSFEALEGGLPGLPHKQVL